MPAFDKKLSMPFEDSQDAFLVATVYLVFPSVEMQSWRPTF